MPNVARGVVEAVVVVPLEGGPFGPAVLFQVVDVGAPAAGLDQQIVARLARREAARDIAVEGACVGRGQPAWLAVELGAVVAAVQVDGQLPHRCRQLMVKRHLCSVASRSPDRRAWKVPTVSPHPRPLAGQDLDLGLADRDRQVRIAQHLRDRQGCVEWLCGDSRRRVARRQQCRGAEAQREGRGKRTAAQGAEESSAPQARRH